MERVDMGSQAETSSSSKRDMGSYSSTMKPSDVKALTYRYNIPRDLHPVAVSSVSDKKMNAEYERLFSKTYSYVDRISHLSEKSV
ncbi:hypothetical protein Tco_0416649 [Tanacetum coccineum]